MEYIATLKNVNRTYRLGDSEVHALCDFNFQLQKGVVLLVVGPSGSGKSTLLNILGCIDKPSSGYLEIGGKDVTELPLEQLSRMRLHTMGFIFQNFSLIPVLTAYENVELPLLFRDFSGKEVREKVESTLESVGLSNRAKHYPSQLSGGERQRVAIARALAGSPELIIADEPTANLDSKTAREIVGLFDELNQEYKVTIVLATHDQRLIDMADHILNLEDGRIVEG